MKIPRNTPHYECAPPEFRRTPVITGSFELDAVIAANGNKDIPARLKTHCPNIQETAYGERTGYNGYSGYSKDD